MSIDRSSPWAIGSLVMVTIAVVFSLGTFCQILINRPPFERMFHEMGTTLPLITQFVLSPYILVTLFVLLALGVLNVFLTRNARLRLVLATVHLFLVLVLREIYVTGLFMPLTELMKTMCSS